MQALQHDVQKYISVCGSPKLETIFFLFRYICEHAETQKLHILDGAERFPAFGN